MAADFAVTCEIIGDKAGDEISRYAINSVMVELTERAIGIKRCAKTCVKRELLGASALRLHSAATNGNIYNKLQPVNRTEQNRTTTGTIWNR